LIIVVGGTKGGTGKTTLVTNLAVIDITRGKDAILIDADKQGSAAAWSEVRDSKEVKRIPCVQKYGKGLVQELQELSRKYENVFVDAGGHDAEEMRAAMVAADLLLIPVRPNQLDVWSIPRVIELVAQSSTFNPKLRFFFVINGAHVSPNVRDAQEVLELLEGQPVAKTIIHHRRAFAKAPMSGIAVTEMMRQDKDVKAVEEMQSLYEEVMT
jgi:chromosome partitioning protein